MPKMGLQFGLEGDKFCKRNFRWIFEIPDVCGDETPGANALPPEKSARPNLNFKEMDINHLIEDVYYPAKPDWKPITVTVYDIQRTKHPVFDWLRLLYNPRYGQFFEPNRNGFIKECYLRMLTGCGDVVETWVYEDCWPQSINFQTLDMGNMGLTMCDFSLRYARAYVLEEEDETPVISTPVPVQRTQEPPINFQTTQGPPIQ